MADIGRVIDRLGLGAQHHVVHHRFMRLALGGRQDAVEGAGLDHLALGEVDVEGAQEVGKGEQLFLRGRVVHPVDQRRARLFQRLGGGDIGQHHEFLDQLHGFQPLAIGDGGDLAVGAQDRRGVPADPDPADRACRARRSGICRPPRHRPASSSPSRSCRHRACRRRRLAPGHRSAAPPSASPPRRKSGFSCGRACRTPCATARQGRSTPSFSEHRSADKFLRQHRHHAVGEIGAVAALEGFPVQRRAGRDVMGDIGDGDQRDMTAGIGGIVIRPRPHRIVMVAGVGRIDGDQRDGAQIGAAARVHWLAPPWLPRSPLWEIRWECRDREWRSG